ncbi:MAG: hypothetical protein K9J30_07830 [Bacteroidales bacterium]|nr:hypothetical protein [Bacteroidales bacterium]
MKRSFFAFLFAIISLSLAAQESEEATSGDKAPDSKSGWSFGGVPVVAFDSDIGFKYGALVNLYDYGDGKRYPMYDHSIYLEWSRTTKGSGINQFTWDTDKLIPGIRSFLEVSYRTEQALDFYGFNGAQALYNSDFETDTTLEDLRNSYYYRHSRKLLRINADFQGKIIGNKFRWLLGVGYYDNVIDSVDIDAQNEGKTSYLLSRNSIYGLYVDEKIIPADQANGGGHTLLKAGLVYDTRDNEPNPFKGIWTEMQLHYVPSFLSTTKYGYSRYALTHRQYFTIIPDWMNVAYRLSFQGKLTGEMPFYMMPYLFNTAPQMTSDGVGGSKTVRGILRNRLVGEGIAYGNLELRGKVVKFNFLNQNWYIALSAFLDAGMVTQKFEYPATAAALTLPDSDVPVVDLNAKEVPHLGYGGGLHIVLNENFIVTVDFGFAAKKADGNTGLYIGLNFLY